jgi:hypothetical protein|tara:strand:- start:15 stop:428 length:414 start_codon:yes stop_codon:yes gene_type:complete
MNKKNLVKNIEVVLDENSIELSIYNERDISKFLDELILFKSNVSEEVFLKTITVLRRAILEESDSDYTVSQNAIFGDFKDIRNVGFYRRYLHNVKLTSTYIKAYQLTENEYVETFGKKRYSSYDSFRIVKNRIIKKK